jgi:undecaprenyl-diphosphatase
MNSLMSVKNYVGRIIRYIKKQIEKDKDEKYFFINAFMFLASFIISIVLILHYCYEGNFSFDKAAINYTLQIRSEALSNIFEYITVLGNVGPNTILTILVIAVLIKQKKIRAALFFIINILGIWGINSLLKELFKRTRPPGKWLVNAAGYSFPSGHAMIYMGFSLLLIYYIIIFFTKGKERWILSAVILTLAVLVGLSRIYLGVHYLSDVLTGWSIAALWTSISITIYRILNN